MLNNRLKQKIIKSFYEGRLFRIYSIILRILSFFIYFKKKFNVNVLSTGEKFKFSISLSQEYKKLYPTLLWRAFGIYEPYTSLAIKKYVNKDDEVLELGAAYGYFSIQFSKVCKSLYSVEPNSLCFSYLKKNLDINKCSNVKIYKEAIGNPTVGNIKLFDGTKIKPITLQTFLKDKNIKPTFIFIDCDSEETGDELIIHEFVIIRMIMDHFKDKKIKIICETKHHQEFKKIIDGYKIFNYTRFSHRHYFISNH